MCMRTESKGLLKEGSILFFAEEGKERPPETELFLLRVLERADVCAELFRESFFVCIWFEAEESERDEIRWG